MRPITVAIADINQEKRKKLEQLLQQDKQRIDVLMDVVSNHKIPKKNERRLKSRADITLIEDCIARTKRLRPRILLVNAQQFLEVDDRFLLPLCHECPETQVILLIDKSVEENHILMALANGARGFLNASSDLVSFSKAVCMVEQGEAWVPRKMLGKIMEKISYTCHRAFYRGLL